MQPALIALEHAVKLNAGLWRAHDYIGRIYRHRHFPRAAAEAFTRAVSSAPPDEAPYNTLTWLYLRWGYDTEAVQVAKLATTTVPGSFDAWHQLAMGLERTNRLADAIDAYTEALARLPDPLDLHYHRGKLHYQLGRRAEARADLEAFVTGNFTRPWMVMDANRMLLDLVAKPRK